MGMRVRRGGALIAPELSKYVAEEVRQDNAVQKERRKAREEKTSGKGDGKKNGKKDGKGDGKKDLE